MVAVNRDRCAEGLEYEGLSGRQRQFALEYCRDFNGTQAAIRAGYSRRGAHVQGIRLLRNATISAAISKAMEERAERLELTTDDVLRKLMDEAENRDNSGRVRIRALELLGRHLGMFKGHGAKKEEERKISITITQVYASDKKDNEE